MQAISWFCNLYMQELLELKKVLNSDLEQLTTVRYLSPCLSIYTVNILCCNSPYLDAGLQRIEGHPAEATR